MGSTIYSSTNIFNQKDFEIIIYRIAALQINSSRTWGQMQLNEMLAHCSLQLKLALGEIEAKKNEGSFFLRTPLGQWLGLYGPAWPKGTVTPSQMKIVKQKIMGTAFNEERISLIKYIEKFRTFFNFEKHPFFGSLNKEQWGRLVLKHLDHHLRQFGV